MFGFPPGRSHYIPATRRLRRLLRARDLRPRPRPLRTGRAGVRDSPAPARSSSASTAPTSATTSSGRSRGASPGAPTSSPPSPAPSSRPSRDGPGLPPVPGSAVLPCGPDLGRFRPIPRAEARRELGLDPDGRYLLFPANPARPEKRADRAAELAAAAGAELLTGGSIEPDQMPLWVNAANAVLVTSDYEGFGLDLPRGARLRRPGPLDPGRDRALRPRRGSPGPSAPPSRPAPGESGWRRTSRRPTPGSTAAAGPPRSRRRGWPSGRSSPTATLLSDGRLKM